MAKPLPTTEWRIGKIKLQFGQEANQIYLPEEFRSSDLEIYDNESNKHGYLTEVKITGTVKYTDKDWTESLDRQIKKCENIKEDAKGIDKMELASLKRAQERVEEREKESNKKVRMNR